MYRCHIYDYRLKFTRNILLIFQSLYSVERNFFLNSLCTFSTSAMHYYVTVCHADGQYQAAGFRGGLKERVTQAQPNTFKPEFRIPVLWDTSHWLDLCVSNARKTSKFFKYFLERGNNFSGTCYMS